MFVDFFNPPLYNRPSRDLNDTAPLQKKLAEERKKVLPICKKEPSKTVPEKMKGEIIDVRA